jgi:NAD+ diphosphatase
VMMALVHRDGELLLTRKPGYALGRYTVVAGFVEAGESLEQCLAREVKEEVGVDIRNPRYFGSQPWPFPNSLVMAFSAEWAAGEVVPDPGELEDARWFPLDALPDLPETVHISRQLIDDTLARLKDA